MLVLLGFVQAFSALVLAVTLYAVTREEDEDLAMLPDVPCRRGDHGSTLHPGDTDAAVAGDGDGTRRAVY